jgi:TRAP-type C4-dicarboxylate transport system permease small subunit
MPLPRRVLTALTNAAAYLAAFFVAAIFVMMIAQSIMRGIGMRTGGMNDIVAWFTAAAAFLAMAHAFRNGDFVRVTLLLEKVSPRARRLLEVISLAIATWFVGYLAFWAVRYTYESWQFKDMPTGQIALPMWIPQLSFALGAILLLAVIVDEFIVVLRGGTPNFVRVVEERHARGDYSEDL